MKLLDFALTLGKLKKIKRTGWINKSVPNPESVAEHSFRTAVLAMLLAPKVGADSNKAIKMALIHDMGESEIGDIVTKGKSQSSLKDKIDKERQAVSQIFSQINGDEYIKLFDEFERNETKEAKLVKQIDKLEMAIQAFEYEKEHKIDLQEFFDDADSKIQDKEIRKIMNEILKLRNKD